MIKVPVGTIEKPITVVDYIAGLLLCSSISEVHQYSEQVPMLERMDERYTKAVAIKLGDLRKNSAAA